MKIHIIGTNGFISDSQRITSSDLYNLTGGNTGNLVFQYAVTQLLVGEKNYYDWSFSPEQLNELGGVLVIPAANFAHPNFDLTSWADKLEKLKLPVITIGLGAQIFSRASELKLKEGTLRFLKILSERSQSVWVRGNKTAEALSQFGIHNVEPIGCPSNFINLNKDLGKAIQKRVKSKFNSIIYCPTFYSYNAAFENNIYQYTKNYLRALVVQEPLKALEYVRNINLFGQADALSGLGFLETLSADDLSIFDRVKTSFYDATVWSEYSKTTDLCVGSRIHGCSIAWQSQVPSVVQAYDERIGELADIMGLPVERVRGREYQANQDRWKVLISDAASKYDENRLMLAAKARKYLEANQLSLHKDFLDFSSSYIPKENEVTGHVGLDVSPVSSGFLERYNHQSISGWAIGKEKNIASVLSCYINNKWISDIKADAYRHDMSAQAGFHFNVPEWAKDAGAVKIDVRCQQTDKSISNSPVLLNLHPSESKKVLIGKNDYLFLTNDSNQTIDQITGKKILNDQQVEQWDEFFEHLKKIDKKNGISFIVAPCKEVVYEKFLPSNINVSESRNIRAIEKIWKVKRFNKKFSFCYPIDELTVLSESYSKGDTHWTYPAAFETLKTTLIKNFGAELVESFVNKHLSGYRDTYSHSDLVSKFGETCIERRQMPIMTGNVKSEVLNDNVYQNTGKTVRYSFDDAPVKMKCLVLHDSFGEWFAPFLSRFFSEVTFRWDSDLNAKEFDDYDHVIIERAERFLVKPSRVI